MRSTVNGPPSPLGRRLTTGSSNNNYGSENIDNSGCQYGLCALGIVLVAVGIGIIMWSAMSSDTAGNHSSNIGRQGDNGSKKIQVSPVGCLLVFGGVITMLLSLCMRMINKRWEQQRFQEAQNRGGVAVQEQEEEEIAKEQEAVGSGQYPVHQSNPRPSPSRLPSYDDLLTDGGVEYEYEESEVINTDNSQPEAGLRIEPLTPPLLYEDKVPPLED